MRLLHRKIEWILLCTGLFALPSLSLAWDGYVTGVLTQIDVTDGANSGFRVYLPAAMCANTYNWAYLNSTDSNYTAYAAALLMAKSQGLTVQIYSNRDANEYCHIGYISIV
ncbi:MAG: hypothetical protein QOF42_2470 [Gammaproteobacteria bacterium]|jgi:hypothetical protein|nr:hypothetical protein [Gammaproteobacteria bacterium]